MIRDLGTSIRHETGRELSEQRYRYNSLMFDGICLTAGCPRRHEFKFAVWLLAQAYSNHSDPRKFLVKDFEGDPFRQPACFYETYYPEGCGNKHFRGRHRCCHSFALGRP